MLKLSRPQDTTSKVFYVSSEENPKETHIVVKFEQYGSSRPIYFCDCKDFMIRRLLPIAQGLIEPCKHGSFVTDVVNAQEKLGVDITTAVRK